MSKEKKIWGDNYIHLDDTMTDEEIIAVIENRLANKDNLIQISAQMYNKIHDSHTRNDEKEKLYRICESILESTPACQPKPTSYIKKLTNKILSW